MVDYIEYLKIVINSIKRRKLRSFLNFLSIMIGIAAVLTLIFVGIGFQESVKETFEMMGVNKIFITPKGSYFGMGTGQSFSDHDLNIIKKINGIDEVGGISYKLGRVEYGNEQVYTWVVGLDTKTSTSLIEEAQNINIEKGRNLKKDDKYKCLVGYLIANNEVFDKKVSIGKELSIEGKPVKVIGVVSRIGNPQDDSSIWIPLEGYREIFGTSEEYNLIIAKVKKNYETSTVAEKIKEKLRKDRGLKEGEDDFQVQTSEQIIRSFSQIFSIIFIVLTGIATISLIVGGVGMMNTMYTAVLERTKEIGIMKAVGARNFDVLSIFVIESGILGLIGGVGGVILGTLASFLVSFIANAAGYGFLKIKANFLIMVMALLFSFLIGIISGYLPAKEAAKLKPIDALRYE